MGLCKCPKRKVTNQFCFEHRVNVCEHCMVTNHSKVSTPIKDLMIIIRITSSNSSVSSNRICNGYKIAITIRYANYA